jgi:hypothetical protein
MPSVLALLTLFFSFKIPESLEMKERNVEDEKTDKKLKRD